LALPLHRHRLRQPRQRHLLRLASIHHRAFGKGIGFLVRFSAEAVVQHCG
jgi:hypothetical protein